MILKIFQNPPVRELPPAQAPSQFYRGAKSTEEKNLTSIYVPEAKTEPPLQVEQTALKLVKTLPCARFEKQAGE